MKTVLLLAAACAALLLTVPVMAGPTETGGSSVTSFAAGMGADYGGLGVNATFQPYGKAPLFVGLGGPGGVCVGMKSYKAPDNGTTRARHFLVGEVGGGGSDGAYLGVGFGYTKATIARGGEGIDLGLQIVLGADAGGMITYGYRF